MLRCPKDRFGVEQYIWKSRCNDGMSECEDGLDERTSFTACQNTTTTQKTITTRVTTTMTTTTSTIQTTNSFQGKIRPEIKQSWK